MNEFIDALEQLEKESEGGGGYIGKVEVAFGYKCFVPGASNAESFFPFEVGNEESRNKALANAIEFYNENGITADDDVGNKKIKGLRRNASLQIKLYRDDVLNREVTWKDDRYFLSILWTDGYKQIVKPPLHEIAKSGIDISKPFWARVSFAEDPTGRTTVNQNGETVPELVAFVAEAYPSKEAAEEAAGSGSTTSPETPSSSAKEEPKSPDGYDEQVWNSVIPEIKKAHENGDSNAKIASDYGVTIPWIVKALNS